MLLANKIENNTKYISCGETRAKMKTAVNGLKRIENEKFSLGRHFDFPNS